ncbi:hypothetical protein BJX99DRAFT_250486 [Aspergillus californicus]
MTTSTTKESPLLSLPPELRLQIYSYLLNIPEPTYSSSLPPTTTKPRTNNQLIIITDTGNKYTTHPIYRALHIDPHWVSSSDKRERLSLLTVNRKLHAEFEDYIYTGHTLFFLNSFDLDYLGAFLSTLSPTARNCIRSIGFEVYLFVHGDGVEEGVPKRPWRSYERVAGVVAQMLPGLRRVVFYLDPWFSACCADRNEVFGPWCEEKSVLARGVGFLVGVFGNLKEGLEMEFLPASVTLPV